MRMSDRMLQICAILSKSFTVDNILRIQSDVTQDRQLILAE